MSEYGGFRQLTTSPYVTTTNRDSCGKYKVCSQDVTNEDTDTYKIMCETCANGFIPDPSQMNEEVRSEAGEARSEATS